jgi:nitroimidazol reductase NimA-like FMN-containing flavoprotein (pyridoxamine 5'-phosphate oxidase superfamily)
VSYTSVIAFGSVSFTVDPAAKALFCDRLMAKYGAAIAGHPAGYYPRLNAIAVFGLRIASFTGKRVPLPADTQRWPLLDRTRSPGAHPAE